MFLTGRAKRLGFVGRKLKFLGLRPEILPADATRRLFRLGIAAGALRTALFGVFPFELGDFTRQIPEK